MLSYLSCDTCVMGERRPVEYYARGIDVFNEEIRKNAPGLMELALSESPCDPIELDLSDAACCPGAVSFRQWILDICPKILSATSFCVVEWTMETVFKEWDRRSLHPGHCSEHPDRSCLVLLYERSFEALLEKQDRIVRYYGHPRATEIIINVDRGIVRHPVRRSASEAGPPD